MQCPRHKTIAPATTLGTLQLLFKNARDGFINRVMKITQEQYIEITSWLVSAYDFYSRAVKNRKRMSERSERVSLRFFTTSE